MKSKSTTIITKQLSTLVACLACGVLAMKAGAQTTYRAVPGASSVKIQGTSTAHDWEMKGTLIGGKLEFPADVKLDTAQAGLPGAPDGKVAVKATALIPVASVKSEADHLPEVMERLMQEALKEPENKLIAYNLTEMKLSGQHEAGKPFQFDTTGTLAIAGTTNTVSFPVTIEKVEPGKLKISASVPVKMTDYGVTPPAPSFGLGLMRCGDKVTIVLEWIVEEKK